MSRRNFPEARTWCEYRGGWDSGEGQIFLCDCLRVGRVARDESSEVHKGL